MENKESLFYDASSNTWAYVTKFVDLKTFQIRYLQKDGFETMMQAAQSMQKDVSKFENDLKNLKKSAGMEFTFGEYLDYWFHNILSLYGSSNYRMVMGWAIYKILIPAIHQTKDVLLHQVTTTYLNELLKIAAPISPSAAPQARKVLGICIKDAIANGYIRSNPMLGVTQYRFEPPKIVSYKKEDLKKLLYAAQKDSNFLEILLSLCAGLRGGEVLGLRFTDFDMENKTVSIQRQYTRDYEIKIGKEGQSYQVLGKKASIKPPKSESSYRTIKLPDFLLREVEKRKQQNHELFKRKKELEKEYGEYVCISHFGKIKATGTVLSALKRITMQQGLPKLSVHDLRHLFGTMLIEEAKMDLETVSHIMGHKNVNTTLEIYIGILSSEEQTRAYIETNLNPMNAISKKEETE